MQVQEKVEKAAALTQSRTRSEYLSLETFPSKTSSPILTKSFSLLIWMTPVLTLLFLLLLLSLNPTSSPLFQGIVTPNVKDDALPLAKLGRKCGAGIANCLHGCCSQLGVCGHSREDGVFLFSLRGRERRERESTVAREKEEAHPFYVFFQHTNRQKQQQIPNSRGLRHDLPAQVLEPAISLLRKRRGPAPERRVAALCGDGGGLRGSRREVRDRVLQPGERSFFLGVFFF